MQYADKLQTPQIHNINMHPELTIIIPTYRRPEKLHRALSSIPATTNRPHEIIVIDDCPDGSAFEVAKKHGCRYIYKGGMDRGQSHSRNIGINLARGTYISFLDDDDIYAEGGLDRLIDRARDKRGIIFGDYLTFTATMRSDLRLDTVDINKLLICNQIPVGAFVIERSAILRDFDPQLRSHEDWDFLLFHATRMPLVHVPGLTVMIDKTENTTTSTEARRRSLFWLDFLSIYARYPAEHFAAARSAMLQSLGIQIPETLLRYQDVI